MSKFPNFKPHKVYRKPDIGVYMQTLSKFDKFKSKIWAKSPGQNPPVRIAPRSKSP